MRAYLVIGGAEKMYVGSQDEVIVAKREIISAGVKRRDITVTRCEIPATKKELLDFINNLMN